MIKDECLYCVEHNKRIAELEAKFKAVNGGYDKLNRLYCGQLDENYELVKIADELIAIARAAYEYHHSKHIALYEVQAFKSVIESVSPEVLKLLEGVNDSERNATKEEEG